jgi:NADPH-dependent 2,4-dienoyl-CoA reductase/sulfur reductase-like enzyme
MRVVIAGASLAGLTAAETARRAGFSGPITLIGDEDHLPYDRPPLSKEWLDGEAEAAPYLPAASELRGPLDIDVRLGCAATGLDVAGHTLHTSAGAIRYDRLLIATGARARPFPMAAGLAGMHTLRTVDDAVKIRAGLDAGARTVIIGAGFIGSEAASAARRRGLPVTVLEALPVPLANVVGLRAGAALSALHQRNGTVLRCGVRAEAILGTAHVEGVRLAGGEQLPADLIVIGIGAQPCTAWLESSGLTVADGVVCDATLQAGEDVWAAGDAARWHDPRLGAPVRIEHWTNAVDQAAHAMQNLLDPAAAAAYQHTPYFWSDWYGQRIQFAGRATGEPLLVGGEWDGDAFTVLYSDGGLLAGALTLNRPSQIMKYRRLISQGASWQDGLDFAAARNAATGAGAAGRG